MKKQKFPAALQAEEEFGGGPRCGPPEKTALENFGRTLKVTSHEIGCAMDAVIAREVSPELTGMRGMVLGYIVNETRSGRPVYQRDIEERFRVRRSSVTSILQGMEQAGFIARTSVAHDARLKSLAATEKGLRCIENVWDCIARFEHDLRGGLTRQELAAAAAVLDRLRANAQGLRAGSDTPRK